MLKVFMIAEKKQQWERKQQVRKDERELKNGNERHESEMQQKQETGGEWGWVGDSSMSDGSICCNERQNGIYWIILELEKRTKK